MGGVIACYKVYVVCSRKSLKMDGYAIFLGHLVYRLYLYFVFFLVKCPYEYGYPFANLFENTLGMVICDHLVFQVASVSVSPVEYCDHAGVELLWWCEVDNSALFSKADYF